MEGTTAVCLKALYHGLDEKEWWHIARQWGTIDVPVHTAYHLQTQKFDPIYSNYCHIARSTRKLVFVIEMWHRSSGVQVE